MYSVRRYDYIITWRRHRQLSLVRVRFLTFGPSIWAVGSLISPGRSKMLNTNRAEKRSVGQINTQAGHLAAPDISGQLWRARFVQHKANLIYDIGRPGSQNVF